MNLTIDPEFKNLIRPLTVDEHSGLRANIIENGCLDSIKTWGGIIVDGHNRFLICNAEGIEFQTDELEFDSREDVKVWMIKQQLDKRNINDYMRTSLCLKMEGIFREKAKANLSLAGGDRKSEEYKESPLQNSANPVPTEIEPINTRQEIADLAHVSRDTVSKVKYIEDNATEDQIEELKAGTKGVSIHSVYTDMKEQNAPPPVPVEEEEEEEDEVDQDHCMCTPYIPFQDEVDICPCGCGYGFCWTNGIWYTSDQIEALETR